MLTLNISYKLNLYNDHYDTLPIININIKTKNSLILTGDILITILKSQGFYPATHDFDDLMRVFIVSNKKKRLNLSKVYKYNPILFIKVIDDFNINKYLHLNYMSNINFHINKLNYILYNIKPYLLKYNIIYVRQIINDVIMSLEDKAPDVNDISVIVNNLEIFHIYQLYLKFIYCDLELIKDILKTKYYIIN
jgi:hypothetical protein